MSSRHHSVVGILLGILVAPSCSPAVSPVQAAHNSEPLSTRPCDGKNRRLRRTQEVRPNLYELDFDLTAAPGPAKGVATITLQSSSWNECLVLDARKLEVQQIAWHVNGGWIEPRGWRSEEELLFVPTLGRSPIRRIRIHFRTKLQKSRGLFRSGTIVMTQLEPMHAREVFPCLDEPALKSRFKLVLRVPTGWRILGNAPVASQHANDTRKTVYLEVTPPIPTYVVAFAAGSFATHSLVKDNIEARLHVADGVAISEEKAISFLDWALRIRRAASSALGVPYPYRRFDFLVPEDFEFGGMENPGLIVMNRTLFADTFTEETRNMVLAHEIAHQWFGNLVTPESWSVLWLSEELATLAAGLVLEKLGQPSRASSLLRDASPLPEPASLLLELRLEVTTAADVEQALLDDQQLPNGFGVRTTVLFTLLAITKQLGRPKLFDGLRTYLQNTQERGVGRPADLVDALVRVGAQP